MGGNDHRPRIYGLALCILAIAIYGPWVLIGSAQQVVHSRAAAENDTQGAAGEKKDSKEEREKKLKEELELLRLLADAVDQIERNYVDNISRRELIEAAIRGMTSKLDQHSSYIPSKHVESFKTEVESEFGGIGIQISIRKDEKSPSGKLTITSPIYGSPAYRAKLMAGDHIIRIEGKSTKGITLDEAVRRLKGKSGTKVTMTVRHLTGEEKTVTISRERIRVQTVLGDRRHQDGRWNFMYDEEKGIGYIRLTSFARHTSSELRAALRALRSQKVKGLILDLRFNPGGLLSTAVSVCDMFLPKDKMIVSTKGRNIRGREYKATGFGKFRETPMVVLINRFSASASEIVSACLQDHQRAVVVGERSWGKGSVQNIVELQGGKSALKLTTAGYFRPSGRNIHRPEKPGEDDNWGVHPDDGYEVKFSIRDISKYFDYRRQRDVLGKTSLDPNDSRLDFDDRQLKTALEHLSKKLDEQVAKKVEPPSP